MTSCKLERSFKVFLLQLALRGSEDPLARHHVESKGIGVGELGGAVL